MWRYTSTPYMHRDVNTDRFNFAVFPRGKYKSIIQNNVNCASVHIAFCEVISYEAFYVTNKQTNIRTNKVRTTPKNNYENKTNKCI